MYEFVIKLNLIIRYYKEFHIKNVFSFTYILFENSNKFYYSKHKLI